MIERDDWAADHPTHDVRERIEIGDDDLRCEGGHLLQRYARIAIERAESTPCVFRERARTLDGAVGISDRKAIDGDNFIVHCEQTCRAPGGGDEDAMALRRKVSEKDLCSHGVTKAFPGDSVENPH